MQDMFLDFVAWFIETFKGPPMSAILITAVSVSITVISNLAMKRFSDVRQLKRHQAEIKEYQELTRKAEQTQNEKLLRKMRRRKAYIDRIQKEMVSARCRPMLFFIIPFMLLFSVLSGYYSDPSTTPPTQKVVAVIPFNIQKALPFLVNFVGVPYEGGFGLYFFPFYLLVGLGLGQIIQRIQGVSLS